MAFSLCQVGWREEQSSGILRQGAIGWEERELEVGKTMLPSARVEQGFPGGRTGMKEWEA